MNPYYDTPGYATAHEAFVEAIQRSYRWAQPFRIWHDKDGWYAFGAQRAGTGKNIGITYEAQGHNIFDPKIRVKLFFNK